MNALLKYGGAVLASVLLVVVIATVAGAIFGDDQPAAPEPQVAQRPNTPTSPMAPPQAAPPTAIAPAPIPAPPPAAPGPIADAPVVPAPATPPVAPAPGAMADAPAAPAPIPAPAPAPPTPPAAAAPGAVGAGTADIGTRLAAANPTAGQTVRTRCAACHTFDQNGANRVGPNLWNVVGRDKGSVAGFNYSQPMRDAPGTWTFDELDKFLAAPAQHIPGNRMNFAGLPQAADRANLIAHLRTLSTAPLPLPTN